VDKLVIDASHLLVFASKINIGDEEVDDTLKILALQEKLL
jgi:hypothetical protein